MDLKKEILKEHTKQNTLRIIEWVAGDGGRIELLVNLFLYGEYRVSQRTSWILSGIAERNPLLLQQYVPLLLPRMIDKTVHIAVKRNMVRLLQFVKVPESLKGFVLDTCFTFLEDPREGNAVQVFSMTVIENFTNDFPEIIPEFKLIIEKNLVNGASPAFKSRANKILKSLER